MQPQHVPPITDAQARALAAIIRDRVIGSGQLAEGVHLDTLPSGALRLEATVVVLVDSATADTFRNPPPEFDDDTCPVRGHTHHAVDRFGGYDEGTVWECRETLHQWRTWHNVEAIR